MLADFLPISAFSASPARLPRIVVVATGGTIAGALTETTAAVSLTAHYQAGILDIASLLQALPALDSIAHIEAEQSAQIDSKDVTFADWSQLVYRVNALLMHAEIDGVVITHGTDTLEETAFLLHLGVKSSKPVVLTAAMRPATALSADGPLNLFNAVTVAAHQAAIGQGVLVVLNNQIHCARDVTKTSTYAVDAFRSPEVGALGWVQDGRVEFQRAPQRRHTCASEFETPLEAWPMVEIVTNYAGASSVLVDALMATGVRGIVAAGTGNGSLGVPLQQALAQAVKRGVAVVRASRVGAGHVMRNGAAPDDELGFVSAGTLNPYKARVLLMLALTGDQPVPTSRLQSIFDTY
ncbi:asparaginase [Mycoavidus sp. B2-EB]|uniref:asparaginase n=1 Tax=Mycoavidus sp. B2-EB TaxID=2651972 RepID=UPI00162AA9D1|nr:asparaginase [Mycoavidus sp. B2-EB]BBO59556.1 L-asparaginase [Mycoavidus sp. B2-EB]